MKILDAKNFNHRLVMTLDQALPENFANHSQVSVDGHVFKDALIAMISGQTSRRVLSVQCDDFVDVLGKELTIIDA
ncbi:hypothetical protein [Streptococcus sp. sy018]|uniref:hypothetical protein n=1 Tax=Streptococcus sp. sy018 TaxID=2600147 RepID=UPI0011B704A5|nr:hypothetical protein [Streptococcus sp. sy018]TWS94258.1 hypothetical protein FRX52_05025 [Streptococcus sp. sy018]